MFRVECMVEDRNLAEVLRRLAGVAQDVHPMPVVMAPPDGSVITMFRGYLDKHHINEVTPQIARDFQASVGRAPGGANLLLVTAVTQGLLKRQGRGSYAVVRLLTHDKKKEK